MKELGQKRVVWIVGASSGIGYELVKTLDGENTQIYVSSRSEQPLLNLVEQAKGEIVSLPLDITDADACAKAGKIVLETGGRLDTVVVNAGICEYIDSDVIDTATVRQVMETNFFGVMNVVNTALPLLRRSVALNHTPQLVFVSSSVTYQALPRAGAYGASKAALRYFAECLKLDLQREGIDVRVVSPGFVKTPLTDKNDFPMPARISASLAAKKIVAGMANRSFDIHFPKKFTWVLKCIALLPDVVRFRIVGHLSRHPLSASANQSMSKGDCA